MLNPNPYASPQSPPGRAGIRCWLRILASVYVVLVIMLPPSVPYVVWCITNPERSQEVEPSLWFVLACLPTTALGMWIAMCLDRWIDERWAD